MSFHIGLKSRRFKISDRAGPLISNLHKEANLIFKEVVSFSSLNIDNEFYDTLVYDIKANVLLELEYKGYGLPKIHQYKTRNR
jgi:hypothetical protein